VTFEGKVVLVTGAGQGIGRATAILAATRGAAVGLCDWNPETGDETATIIREQGGRAWFVQADVSVSAEVERFVAAVAEEFGRIDALINNAGIDGSSNTVDQLAEAEWRRVIGVNLDGAFFCSKYVVPYLRRAGGGAIVNTSSVLALATLPSGLAYTTSKAALIGFTRVMANQLGPDRIRVNCVLPGSTDTPMIWAGLTQNELPTAKAEVAAAQPLQRYGQPEEIARVSFFLASDEASFITGESVVVDGGLLTRIATTR
jgi:NAD(P)-dependent dehydrogenase (short-subunit alcohol dehydrogenase family)